MRRIILMVGAAPGYPPLCRKKFLCVMRVGVIAGSVGLGTPDSGAIGLMAGATPMMANYW